MNNNELNEIDIKNRTCYYFDDIINTSYLNLDNILIDEKSYENILICNVTYKTPYGAKPKKYDSTKYVALFYSNEKYERSFDKIRYLIMLKSNILDVYLHKHIRKPKLV